MKRLALLFLPIVAFAAAPTTDWSPNATGTIAWQSNVSNGEASWDRISALQLGVDVLASSQYQLSATDVLHGTVHLAGDWFPRFSQLGRGAAGPRVDWQHTFGKDEFAPVFTAEVGGDYAATVESARRGIGGMVTLRLSKRFGESWRAAITQRFDEFNAKRSVFDSSSHETAVEIGRDINESTRFTLGGRWREGDVVTYADYDRPDLVAIAHDTAQLKTFRHTMTAYAVDARTIGGRASLVHATSEASAVVLAYDYARSSRTGLRFANSTISLSFIQQY